MSDTVVMARPGNSSLNDAEHSMKRRSEIGTPMRERCEASLKNRQFIGDRMCPFGGYIGMMDSIRGLGCGE
jgi:hypothetical protein